MHCDAWSFSIGMDPTSAGLRCIPQPRNHIGKTQINVIRLIFPFVKKHRLKFVGNESNISMRSSPRRASHWHSLSWCNRITRPWGKAIWNKIASTATTRYLLLFIMFRILQIFSTSIIHFHPLVSSCPVDSEILISETRLTGQHSPLIACLMQRHAAKLTLDIRANAQEITVRFWHKFFTSNPNEIITRGLTSLRKKEFVESTRYGGQNKIHNCNDNIFGASDVYFSHNKAGLVEQANIGWMNKRFWSSLLTVGPVGSTQMLSMRKTFLSRV